MHALLAICWREESARASGPHSSGETTLNNLTGVALTCLSDRPASRRYGITAKSIGAKGVRASVGQQAGNADGLLSNYIPDYMVSLTMMGTRNMRNRCIEWW